MKTAPAADPYSFGVQQVVTGPLADRLHASYVAAFEPLRTRAAARHVLPSADFFAELADPRIDKHLAWEGSTQDPVALATVTTRLDAVPWISPDYFQARYPGPAARGAVSYLGLAFVVPGIERHRLFERLIGQVVQPVLARRGILAYDVCGFNNSSIQFARRAESILCRAGAVRVDVADVQTFYTATFS